MRLENVKPISQIQEERENEQLPLFSLGQELAQMKISNMQKDSTIQTLGQQLALVKLEIIQLKGGNE